MAFSTGFGLTCMCFIMLLFLPGQGQCQCPKIKLLNLASKDISVSCCTNTSKGLIREPVDACYVQKENGTNCKIPAYIFVTRSKEICCVDPDAWWLPARLEKLKDKGITCEPLVKSLHQPK